jgi:hypothetical protein
MVSEVSNLRPMECHWSTDRMEDILAFADPLIHEDGMAPSPCIPGEGFDILRP